MVVYLAVSSFAVNKSRDISRSKSLILLIRPRGGYLEGVVQTGNMA